MEKGKQENRGKAARKKSPLLKGLLGANKPGSVGLFDGRRGAGGRREDWGKPNALVRNSDAKTKSYTSKKSWG